MTTVRVASQSALDQALADGAERIIINSTAGVWLVVRRNGSSHVEARESSHVVAGQYVAVHLHSQQVTLSGGVVIDLTALDLTDPVVWLAHSGVSIGDGRAVVYKAVSDNWQTGRGAQWTYEPGATVTADDWAPTAECGQGLHFGVTPSAARAYHRDATRYVACEITVAESVPLGDKIKARSCRVLHEVTIDGERVEA